MLDGSHLMIPIMFYFLKFFLELLVLFMRVAIQGIHILFYLWRGEWRNLCLRLRSLYGGSLSFNEFVFFGLIVRINIIFIDFCYFHMNFQKLQLLA